MSRNGSAAPHRGLVLDDQGKSAALRRHFQSRLKILSGILAFASTAFYVVLRLAPKSKEASLATDAESLVHAFVCVAAWVAFLVLSRVPLSLPRLKLVDTLIFALAAGGALVWYAARYEKGDTDVVAFLAIFLIARAVVVPGTALRTLWLAAPLPALLLGIDLWKETPHNYDGSRMATDAVASYRIWVQVTLWFGLGVAAAASHVTYALRAKLAEAEVFGPYTLLERLGRGGMGEVWRANHALLKRPTAIKLLRPDLTDADTIRRFEHEVQKTASLAHPHVIQIYDYGHTADGIFYYAMEYLEGMDLRELLDEHGPLPPGRVVHFLLQACAGLQAAHDEGLVHRDVKLENLFVCRRGRERDVLKVVDFGLVKDLRSTREGITIDGEFCGTLETLAPELALGRQPSPACDLYGLGAVGFTLLTGQPLFEGGTPLELVGQHLHITPVRPSQRGVDVPPPLEAILARCLAKDPEERPASAGALAEQLLAVDVRPAWTAAEARAWWDEPRGYEGTSASSGKKVSR